MKLARLSNKVQTPSNDSSSRCSICDGYRTVDATIFNNKNGVLLSAGIELSNISPFYLYNQVTGKTIDELVSDYQSNVKQKDKINWLRNILNPLSSFHKNIDKTRRNKVVEEIMLFLESQGKVPLNSMYQVLNKNAELVNGLFDSTLDILITLLHDGLVGSKIANIIGFHNIIMSINCLIRIDLNSNLHTIKYQNPGRHKMNQAKFFICLNNKKLLRCSLVDDNSIDSDYAFLTIDLPTSLLNTLETTVLTNKNYNQEKLIWQHTIMNENENEKNDRREKEGGRDKSQQLMKGRNACESSIKKTNKKKGNNNCRRVSWNNIHHLQTSDDSRGKKNGGIFSTN